MTKRYIDNLLSLNWNNLTYHIVVVDNCSPNSSGGELFEYFENNKRVTVLLMKSNLGFSKGNNVGIKYLREKYNCEIVAVSNNDIYIKNKDFFSLLNRIYLEEKFAVLGPDVFSVDKKIHQSPIRMTPINKIQLEKLKKNMQKKLIWMKLLIFLDIYPIVKIVLNGFGIRGVKESHEFQKCRENAVIHGAFFVLTDIYFNKYPDGLYDKLFLYMEEDALALRCNKKSLKCLYYPDLKVEHYDGRSTRLLKGNRLKKNIFELENTIKSINILLGEDDLL